MISFILAIILAIWCIVRRFSEGGKIEPYPLGMPRGTVRAYITLLIISFPFHYLIIGKDIPGLIINAIFVLVAFYFEARKSKEERIKQFIKEIKDPKQAKAEKKEEKKPLYLPKYSVRSSILTILIIILFIKILQPDISFEITETLIDLLLIVSLFIIGAIFRGIGNIFEKSRIKKQLETMGGLALSDNEILLKIKDQESSWLKRKGKSLLSLIMIVTVLAALILYTIDLDFVFLDVPIYEFSLRGILLILINAYYGFRD